MKAIFCAALSLLLLACTATPVYQAENLDALFADALFSPPQVAIERDKLFALTPPMRKFLADRVTSLGYKKGTREALFEAMQKDLKLDYDAQYTRTAAEAFEARSGNCLSLVILTAALARQLDLPVRYQNVAARDVWSRSGDLAFRNRHVNIALGTPTTRYGRHVLGAYMVIDFIPSNEAAMYSSHPIAEDTVVAMFMNNRAAEYLEQGAVNEAYWWARAALEADPAFISTYNTLGVIYGRNGSLPESERIFRYALMRAPEDADVLGNLAGLLERQGRVVEAEAVHLRLAKIAPFPPFHFYDLATAALIQGEPKRAIALLQQELDRMPYNDQVHFALGLAHLQLGRLRRARDYVGEALKKSTSRERSGIYSAKLEYLENRAAN